MLERLTFEWMAKVSGGSFQPLAPEERQVLANLRAGIEVWGAKRFRRELQAHFGAVLRAFPLWAVSNLAAHSTLPLAGGIFDLVIIDEASQCDVASVVPLLARARRLSLVGDPQQLRHITQLDGTVDQSLLAQHDLADIAVQRFTYRVNSAFDLGDSSGHVPAEARVRLDLHFRSHPAIADYCNEAFYNKTLHVVTATELLKIPRGHRAGIHWTHVAGKIVPGPTGAFCLDEVETVLCELRTLASSNFAGTLGVVTTFRQQMIRLRDAVEKEPLLGGDFARRTQLHIHTANGFQGGERDVMLFSLCAGLGLAEGTMRWLRQEANLFNVAVSRARAVLNIVGDRNWALASGVPFIEKLARRTLSRETAEPSVDVWQSPWQRALWEALCKAGVESIPEYPIAGRFLDLAVLSPRKLDIEVDGESVHRTAAGGRKDDDHWRDLQLQSLGWTVCRFWVYELREDMAGCVRRILELSKSSA